MSDEFEVIDKAIGPVIEIEERVTMWSSLLGLVGIISAFRITLHHKVLSV